MLLGITQHTDGADRLHYKWMVLLMLLLSLVTFIVPLHPAFNNNSNGNPPPSPETSKPAEESNPSSNTRVECWCPREFTENNVNYATAYCKGSYLAALSGRKPDAVYVVAMDQPVPFNDDDKKGWNHPETERKKIGRELENNMSGVNDRVQKLVTYQIPLMFLLFALLLMVPHVVWSVFHDCCGTFNLEKTAETVNQMVLKDLTEGGQQNTTSSMLSQLLRPASKTQTILYLVKKILAIIVAAVLIIIVVGHVYPEVDQLTTDHSTSTKHIKAYQNNEIPEISNTTDPQAETPFVFLCDFKIRNLQNMMTYTVQCVGFDDSSNRQTDGLVTDSSSRDGPNTRFNYDIKVLEFESSILRIAIAFLLVLFVSNILNTVGWFCRLMSSGQRQTLGLPSNASLDTVLLANFLRFHGGPLTFSYNQLTQHDTKMGD